MSEKTPIARHGLRLAAALALLLPCEARALAAPATLDREAFAPHAMVASAGLIGVFLALKMITKFVGILPMTRYFRFVPREGMYTTLLMSTGLTFGSISALFGFNRGIIDQQQYTILVTAVIASAVVPTLIAQRWFQPSLKPIEESAPHVS